MAIGKVWIEDGCIGCEACEDIVPEVFVVNDVAVVEDGVDFTRYEKEIMEAADECPEGVIHYE